MSPWFRRNLEWRPTYASIELIDRSRRMSLFRTKKDVSELESADYLRSLMLTYQTKNLRAETPENFKSRIDQFLALSDRQMEGLDDSSEQRDQTITFRWGHNHDFGRFQLQGPMRERHVEHIAQFIDAFHAIPRSLVGMKALDIGCWTGGTSLLLAAMGAEVLAIDEVKKYVDCLAYLKEAFAIENLQVQHRSLYDLTEADLQDRFDIVLFAGVLYHVTDPIVALRLTFNCLRDGGKCLLETTGFRSDEPLISYARRQWNWFDLSPAALAQMMKDVGYSNIEVGPVTRKKRLYAVGQRGSHIEMRRDGLSMRALR
jgi:2-polyprenyl-3-methyl-5-hydroxy-6-metoxy-1,4-benzoquinol methylase